MFKYSTHEGRNVAPPYAQMKRLKKSGKEKLLHKLCLTCVKFIKWIFN